VLSQSEYWGRKLPVQRPNRPMSDPGPGRQASGTLSRNAPPPPAPLRSANISCPRPHQELPSSRSWSRSRVSTRSCPNSLPRPSGAGEGPRLAGSSHGAAQTSGAAVDSSRNPGLGQGGDNWRGAVAPLPSTALPARLRGCPGAAGLSRRCLPTQLPMLAPQLVSMHRRRRAAVCSALLLRTAAPRVNGSYRQPSGAPGSPLGRALPGAGFATNFAGQRKERWPVPSTVSGGRARGARDGAGPETSSAGGVERGGGHRSSYSGFSRSSQSESAP
jgi:hypothetical protein